MDKILSILAKETNGKCYTSFKFCHDNIAAPTLSYEDKPNEKISLKKYGETNHSPEIRDLQKKARELVGTKNLF